MSDAMTCEYCGEAPARRGQRFCCDRHKAAWHREHSPSGVVRSVRKLGSGKTSVIVHFADSEAERALRFSNGDEVVVGGS